MMYDIKDMDNTIGMMEFNTYMQTIEITIYDEYESSMYNGTYYYRP